MTNGMTDDRRRNAGVRSSSNVRRPTSDVRRGAGGAVGARARNCLREDEAAVRKETLKLGFALVCRACKDEESGARRGKGAN